MNQIFFKKQAEKLPRPTVKLAVAVAPLVPSRLIIITFVPAISDEIDISSGKEAERRKRTVESLS